jgi:RHS repeat-associated protein
MFMPKNEDALLCTYHYDPLGRLVASTLAQDDSSERFYMKDRLSTEIQGTVRQSIMQHGEQLLAQQLHESNNVETSLLATDQHRSVLNVVDTTESHSLQYTPYGHRTLENGLLSLLCFNGERPDPVTGHYLLGKGYRAFSPVLMRFNSADTWSPFGKGGLNCYAYCLGDPVNYDDPTGHMRRFLKFVRRSRSRSPSPPRTPVPADQVTRSARGQTHGGAWEPAQRVPRDVPGPADQRAAREAQRERAEFRRLVRRANDSLPDMPPVARNMSFEDLIHAPSAPPRQQMNAMGVNPPRYTDVVATSHSSEAAPPSYESVMLEPYKIAAAARKHPLPSDSNRQIRDS